MLQDTRNINALLRIRPSKSAPCSPIKPIIRPRPESFHVEHKVPLGDTPYVTAKRVQLVEKDPEKAIPLFWAAINAGDRVDSALKDMAIVMKQQNRPEEAIEAIKSLRVQCSDQAQESLDNILLDLYKRCGRLDDQIALLKHKLRLIDQGVAFNGKRTKTARSQGRKFQVSIEQEATRLLGNLGWALMQNENYVEAEAAYRRALTLVPDNNKMCNLGICLMKQGRVAEAKDTLKQVRPAATGGGSDSHLKAYERAQEMLCDLESRVVGWDKFEQNWQFKALLGSSSIWQPQPCIDCLMPREQQFADENVDDVDRAGRNLKPELLLPNNSKLLSEMNEIPDQFLDLKRTRSGNVAAEKAVTGAAERAEEVGNMRRSSSVRARDKFRLELPDNMEFNKAIVAAVLAPVLEDDSPESGGTRSALCEKKMGKRLKVFEDITLALNSPKA